VAKCVGESGKGVQMTGDSYTIILSDVYVHNSEDSTAREHHRCPIRGAGLDALRAGI